MPRQKKKTTKKAAAAAASASASTSSTQSSSPVPPPRDGAIRSWALDDTRSWNAWAEEQMSQIYHPSSPPVVRPSQDGPSLTEYLDEYSFASRKRGMEMLYLSSESLSHLMASEDFEEKWLKAWKEAGRDRREQVVLEMLRRAQEISDEQKQEVRFLAPEITLERLTGGAEGEGYLQLLKSLMVVERAGETPTVRNQDFERVYGLNAGGEMASVEDGIPDAKAVRAYQQEILLIRYSYLLNVAKGILFRINGRPIADEQVVGSYKSDARPENMPRHLATHDNTWSSTKYTQEYCNQCRATGQDRSTPGVKLLRCGKCDKVGRVEFYCSRECQVQNYSWHKKMCGKRLSEAQTVPLFTPSALRDSSTPLNPCLVRQLRSLERQRGAFWIIFRGREIYRCATLAHDTPNAPPGAADLRRRLLKNRDRAIYSKDPIAIGIVGHVALSAVQLANGGRKELAMAFTEEGREELKSLKEQPAQIMEDAKSQLCTEFEVTETELDALMDRVENEGPDWAKQPIRDTRAKHQQHERQLDLMKRGRFLDVIPTLDRAKFEEENSKAAPEKRFKFEEFERVHKLLMYRMLTPELDDPNISEERKRELEEHVLKAADAWKMEDAGVEEMD